MHKHCKWLVNGCRVYVVDTLHWHTGKTDCVALHLHNSSPSRTSPQHSIQSVILLGSGHGQAYCIELPTEPPTYLLLAVLRGSMCGGTMQHGAILDKGGQ